MTKITQDRLVASYLLCFFNQSEATKKIEISDEKKEILYDGQSIIKSINMS